MKVKLIVISTLFILSSCLGTRYLEEDQSILKKQVIKTHGKVSPDELESLTEQEPNTHLFFFPYTHLVYLYEWGYANYDSAHLVKKRNNLAAKFDRKITKADTKRDKKRLQSKKIRKVDKRENKIREGNLRMRWGEKLAVFDSTKYLQTKQNIKDYLFSIGYFDARVDTRMLKTEDQKTSIKLKVLEGPKYKMDSMIYDIEDEKIREIFYTNIKSQLLKGEQYNQDLITQERDRVYDLLSDYGYFDFKRQYVIFEVDSASLPNHKLIVKEIIASPVDGNHKQYTVDSVIFTTNPNNSYVRKRPPSQHNGITFNLTNNIFYERVVDWRIFTYPDTLYNKSAVLETQKQLGYLDMFKFVNVNHDTTGGRFVTNIFTSPLNKYQTSFEGGLSILDQAQGLPGPFINFNAKNRNTFKGLEILQFDGSASIQGINGVDKETSVSSKYSRLQYGGVLSITFPQFVFPIKDRYKSKIGAYNPKTKISIGVNHEDRFGEYERTTFNSTLSYSWQISDNLRFSYQPYQLAYIQTQNLGADFAAELERLEAEGNISYVNAFKSSFVSSSSMSMDYNSGGYGLGNVNAKFLHMVVEYGGLFQPLWGQASILNGLTQYRYVKGNVDFRQSVRVDSKTSFVYRANIGVAYVYGKETSALPYEKYYFAGGSNSIRAWQPRRLGPGSYAIYKATADNSVRRVNYNREQPGDIIMELGAEIRRDFFAIMDYALFVDAGNVWLWKSKTLSNDDDPQGDKGKFDVNNFASEMAIGTGVGLRFDLSFLIMRVDAAYKVFDPAMPRDQRFVLKEIGLNNFWPRINWNIGIGYPF